VSVVSCIKLLSLSYYTKVTCLDVTPGGLATSCDTDGHLLVWTTNNGEVRVRHSLLISRYTADFIIIHSNLPLCQVYDRAGFTLADVMSCLGKILAGVVSHCLFLV